MIFVAYTYLGLVLFFVLFLIALLVELKARTICQFSDNSLKQSRYIAIVLNIISTILNYVFYFIYFGSLLSPASRLYYRIGRNLSEAWLTIAFLFFAFWLSVVSEQIIFKRWQSHMAGKSTWQIILRANLRVYSLLLVIYLCLYILFGFSILF